MLRDYYHFLYHCNSMRSSWSKGEELGAKLVVMRMVYKVSGVVCGRNDDDLTIWWLFLDFQYDWYYILFQL